MATLRGEEKVRYVRNMFARISRRYDLFNSVITLGGDKRWRSIVIDLAVDGEKGVCLDVATGTGELALGLSERGANVVGLDLCPEMMRVGRVKAERSRRDGKINFVLGDGLTLPFPDNTFDCATTGFSLRNVANIPRLFNEMARVVKPGGRIVCIELTRPPSRLFSAVYGLFLENVVPLVGRFIWDKLESEAYSYLPNTIALCPIAEEVKRMMTESGLQEVSYRYLNMNTVAIHRGVK